MFKFMKKTLVVTGILVGVGFLVFGAGLSSYMRTGYKRVKSQIKSSIPVEFEIHRVEDLIDQIGPEMKMVRRLVAEEEVSIAELGDEIGALRKSAAEKGTEVRIIRASLSTETPVIRLAGNQYQRRVVEDDLAARLDNLKAMSGLIDSKKRLLLSRERALEAARGKLVSINTERTRLETMVEQLRAELRQQEALESSCLSVKIDESKLKQAGELAKQVQRRLKVKRKELESVGVTVEVSGIDLGRQALEEPRDIRAEVDAFLAERAAQEVEAPARAPQFTRN